MISDDTAVLGLGNIGPLAGKPVMEGKGILFKRFADIDVFGMDNPAWRKPTWTVTLQTSSSITV